MARRTLILGLCAIAALIALPALAFAQFVDTTEPETVIEKVTASKKGTMRVYFTGSDPVDPVEELTYDCAVDPGAGSDDEEDEGETEDADDESDDEDAEDRKGAGPWEIDCTSPWTAKGLDPGRHIVEVIAFDEELNEDATPATATFKVKKKK